MVSEWCELHGVCQIEVIWENIEHMLHQDVWCVCVPELRSRPGLKARLLTLGESLSQQMVLETLVLKFPSNLNKHKKAEIDSFNLI